MSVDQRRVALVEAAYRVIADHGVEGATTRRICAKAGMPLASFHYAFESRTALLLAVMETAVPTDVSSMLASIVSHRAPATASGREAMRDSMYDHLQLFYRMLKTDPGRMQATISLSMYAHKHSALQAAGTRMYERLYEIAASAMKADAERLDVRWDESPRLLAPVVIGATISITLTYLSTRSDAAVDQIIRSVCDAMESHVVEDSRPVRQ